MGASRPLTEEGRLRRMGSHLRARLDRETKLNEELRKQSETDKQKAIAAALEKLAEQGDAPAETDINWWDF